MTFKKKHQPIQAAQNAAGSITGDLSTVPGAEGLTAPALQTPAPEPVQAQQPQSTPQAENTPAAEPVQAQQPQSTPPAENTPAAEPLQAQQPPQTEAAYNTYVQGVCEACASHPELIATALTNHWTPTACREAISAIGGLDQRNNAGIGANIATGAGGPSDGAVLAAALMQATGVAHEQIDAAALEEADRRHHGRMGLQELIIRCAVANGYRGSVYSLNSGNWRTVAAAAMGQPVQGSFSGISLPGILGSTMNRRLHDGYASVPATWRDVAEVVPVRDFRAAAVYSMSVKGDFDVVPKGGELKHGSLVEAGYSNQARTRGIIITISREDIINDDLGAIASIPHKLGLLSATKLNKVFWQTFLAAQIFDAEKHNLLAKTPLSFDGLIKAVAAFKKLRDANGDYLGTIPDRIVCGPEDEAIADALYTSNQIIGAANTLPSANPHAHKYRPVVCPYIGETADTQGNWYLLGNPAAVAAAQVCFLDGREEPTIETGETQFDTLGISTRCYFDFGCAPADGNAGIKVTAK